MTTYVVRAKRWAHGWELHIDGVGVTQSRTLGGAEQMVRDYVETLTDHDLSDATVVIEPDLGGLEAKAADVRIRPATCVCRTASIPAGHGQDALSTIDLANNRTRT